MTDRNHGEARFQATIEDPASWLTLSAISWHAACVLAERFEAARDLSADTISRGISLPMSIASALGRNHQLWIPFMLQSGYAVETALKSIRVRQILHDGRRCVERHTSGRLRLIRELKTHNLVRLARECGLTLNDQEVRLLRRLTLFVEWAGRYPAGLESDSEADVLPTTKIAVESLLRRIHEMQ